METGLIDWNVPADSILLEPESESTHENAFFTGRVCRNHGIDEIVLVTSAWHMRRALGTFQSAGLDVVPAPVDYQGIRRFFPLPAFLPNVRGLAKTTTAFTNTSATSITSGKDGSNERVYNLPSRGQPMVVGRHHQLGAKGAFPAALCPSSSASCSAPDAWLFPAGVPRAAKDPCGLPEFPRGCYTVSGVGWLHGSR